MHFFCTYFDHHYLPRGLALYQSLRATGTEFELWVLCLSDECHRWLIQARLPGVHLVTQAELEAHDPALLSVKPGRTRIEYYFTCTPSLPLLVLARQPAADRVTYLDADLFFFRDPAPVFAEIGEASIAIIPHRFPDAVRDLERTGIYNVGWVSFRRDEPGLACLRHWREQCLEWCHDREEPGRYGDQKYLDRWPADFPNVVVLQNKGANLAPWNLANHRLREQDGRVWVDADELVFFHFHGFRQISRWLYEPNLRQFLARPTPTIRRLLYDPYRRALASAVARVAQANGSGTLSQGIREEGRAVRAPNTHAVWRQLRTWHRLVRRILRQEYVVARPFRPE